MNQPPSSHPDYIIGAHGEKIPVAALEAASAQTAPAMGEREAIVNAINVHRGAYPELVPGVDPVRYHGTLTVRLLAALTPLLDRREGGLQKDIARLEREKSDQSMMVLVPVEEYGRCEVELAELREKVHQLQVHSDSADEMTANQSHQIGQWMLYRDKIEGELAAKDAEIVALKEAAKHRDETAQFIGKENAGLRAQLTTAHTHMDKLREHRNDLDAACHELEGKLRESEAARGEAEKDSGRLEWLFKEWDGRYSKLLEKPFATYGYDPTIPSFRVAIDRKWSDEDAARAQEAKP